MTSRVGSLSRSRIGQMNADRIAAPAPVEPVVMVSREATMASLIVSLAEAGPPIDADKIMAIREAIAGGQYPIDAKAIAARMIALDLVEPQLS